MDSTGGVVGLHLGSTLARSIRRNVILYVHLSPVGILTGSKRQLVKFINKLEVDGQFSSVEIHTTEFSSASTVPGSSCLSFMYHFTIHKVDSIA